MKKRNRKTRGLHLTACAVAFVLLLFSAGYLIDRSAQAAQQANSGSQAGAGAEAGETDDTARQPETLQADLIIPTEDVTEEVKFYPVTVDDTEMEVLAVKASDGTMRTAFNTCQICFNSGRGYYKQTEYGLQCQNCGNMFSVDEVEVEIGGCNPWPIFDENKTVDETNITIPLAFLQESAAIFQNWRV
ncbi:MAG: DUF2318 domain-containing protein [Clostridiales bacterium]